MKTFKSLLVIFLVGLIINPAAAQVSGFDQVGTTSFQFLQVVPNARAAAMGGVAATTIETSEAVFFNPAMLAGSTPFGAGVAYLDYFQDVTVSSISSSYRFGNVGTFAIQAQVVDYGDIIETRADQLLRDDVTGQYNPGLTGNTATASAMVFGLTYSKALTNRFAFGLTAKFAFEDLIAETANAIVFDGGVIYETGLKSLKLGMMVRNFGGDVTYLNESYPLPQVFAIGVSGQLVGAAGDAFISESGNNRLLIAYDLAQTRDHSQQQHLGLEYALREFVALRGGYKFNFDEESWTLGFGLNVSRFQLDYSYNDYGEFLSNVQRFTLNFIIR